MQKKKGPTMRNVVQIQKPGGGIQTEYINVTPAIAAEWLKRLHPGQRAATPSHVKRLASDMRNNRWVPNGSPIRFDADGWLVDGQHRLLACIEAGFVLPDQVVVRGLSDNAILSIDTNQFTRNAQQVLRMQTMERVSGSVLAAVMLEHLDFDWVSRREVTPIERVEFWQQTPDRVQANAKALHSAALSARLTTPGIVAAGIRVTRDYQDLQAFLCAALSNSNDTTPVGRVLFNHLRRLQDKKTKVKAVLDAAWMVMRASAAHRQGDKTLTQLHPPTDWPLERRYLDGVIEKSRRKR